MNHTQRSPESSTEGRITLVTDTFPPDVNGVAMTLSQLSTRLAQRGYLVDVVRPRPAFQEHSSTPRHPRLRLHEVPGVPVPRYPELRLGLPRALQFAREWRQRRPDAVYVATEGMLGSSAATTARRMGLRTVSGYHTHFSKYLKHYQLPLIEPLVLRFLRRWHNKTSATLTPAPDVAKTLESHGFKNVALLGRGVDCDLYHPAKRSQSLRHTWGARPETPVAICVGRVAPEKNLPLALRSYREMRTRYPDLKLVFVGDGPAGDELRAMDDSVIWAGVRQGEALAAHYASADFFLFPSLTETYGNVLVEAMASGLPTVSFRYAASLQLVRSGVNGYQASMGDEAAFCRKFAQALVAEGPHRSAIGQAARASVMSLSWEAVTTTFERALLGKPDHDRDAVSTTRRLPAHTKTNIHEHANSYSL